MKIYKVGSRNDDNEHTGYKFHTSKRAARADWRESANVDGPQEEDFNEYEVPLTKARIIAFLNSHASHPDNG